MKQRRQLRALQLSQGRLSLDPVASTGLEIELCLIDDTGRPFHGLAETIIQALADRGETRVVHELGDWQLEMNLTPQPLVGHPFTAMYAEAETLLSEISELANLRGGQVILIGILPTVTEDDTSSGNMAPVPRYKTLDNGLWQHASPRPWIVRYPDDVIRTIWVDTVRPEALCTSFQPHFYFPEVENIVGMHNIAVATAGAILAVTGNAPLPLGGRNGYDARSELFAVATNGRCWVEGYLSDPLDPFKKALDFPPIVTMTDWEFGLVKAILGKVPRLRTLNIACGTTWPMIDRIVADTNSAHKRHELRYCSSGPTLADMFATLVLMGGLMANPKAVELTLALSEQQALANFETACEAGPTKPLLWPKSGRTTTERRMPASIVAQDLLPFARAGWAGKGLDSQEVDRFLGPLDDLLKAPQVVNGASWQLLRRSYYLSLDFTPAEANRRMVLDYAQLSGNGAGPSVAYWPHPVPVSDELHLEESADAPSQLG